MNNPWPALVRLDDRDAPKAHGFTDGTAQCRVDTLSRRGSGEDRLARKKKPRTVERVRGWSIDQKGWGK
jgi:hypothetical protein